MSVVKRISLKPAAKLNYRRRKKEVVMEAFTVIFPFSKQQRKALFRVLRAAYVLRLEENMCRYLIGL
jgi:hypothetical protein